MLQSHETSAENLADPTSIDEPFLYHDVTGPGFTCLVTPGGPERQRSFKLKALPERLEYVRNLKIDAYIAQNVFWRPNRQAKYLWKLTSHYVDLDTYKVPELQVLSAERLSARLLAECEERGIPEPTVVVYSGRGLQAKWVLASPQPTQVLPRWKAVQEELCRRLASLGSDRKALDASRVLRVVGTLNTKSGEKVRVVHRARTPTMGASLLGNGAVGYDFEVFAETLLPLTRDEVPSKRKASTSPMGGVQSPTVDKPVVKSKSGQSNGPLRSSQQLAWDRLSDLERLLELRGWQDGAPEGNRNAFVFLAACFLAHAMPATDLQNAVLAYAARFAPDWSKEEVLSCASSALARAGVHTCKSKASAGSNRKPDKYRFTNQSVLEMLAITSAEQECMRTLIGKEEKRRRDNLRKQAGRRAKGCVSRDAYVARSADLAQRARVFRASGLSYSRIAASLGVSKSAAFGYCQMGFEDTVQGQSSRMVVAEPVDRFGLDLRLEDAAQENPESVQHEPWGSVQTVEEDRPLVRNEVTPSRCAEPQACRIRDGVRNF